MTGPLAMWKITTKRTTLNPNSKPRAILSIGRSPCKMYAVEDTGLCLRKEVEYVAAGPFDPQGATPIW